MYLLLNIRPRSNRSRALQFSKPFIYKSSFPVPSSAMTRDRSSTVYRQCILVIIWPPGYSSSLKNGPESRTRKQDKNLAATKYYRGKRKCLVLANDLSQSAELAQGSQTMSSGAQRGSWSCKHTAASREQRAESREQAVI